MDDKKAYSDAELCEMALDELRANIRDVVSYLIERQWKLRFYGEPFGDEDIDLIVDRLNRAIRDYA